MEIRRLHDEIDTLKKDTFGEKESDSFSSSSYNRRGLYYRNP
jgi:hypothetical protein